MKNRINEILKMRKMTQTELAKAMGVTQQYVNVMCSGKATVSIKKLEEVADLLNVSLVDIIDRREDSNLTYCPHCGRPIRLMADAMDEEKAEE